MFSFLGKIRTTSPSDKARFSSNSARPIRFVYCDEQGKLRMDPEAVAMLQLMKEPLGLVSVGGCARQGKSCILNQLLGRSSGFQVASTHRSCTKGLWLWSEPLKRTALDGSEYTILLLDSEGIDAYDKTMGSIDEVALDCLSFITQMTKHIHVRSSEGRTTPSEIGQFSPVFVWLLRDFYLDLVYETRRLTPHDYMELALRPVEGNERNIAAENEIRDSIRALFPDRECYALVRPMTDENELQRLDQISLDKLRPEYRVGLDELTKFVFERTRPKQVGATIMTGPALISLTESYLDALNNGAVPSISSAWQDYKRKISMEPELQCSNAIQSMEKRLRAECHSLNANIDNFVKILDSLISEYEASCHGPGKWQKLAMFFQQSLEGPIFDLAKRLIDEKSDWKRKYDQVLSKQKAKEDQVGSEIEVLESQSTAAEATLAAVLEQSMSAQEEVEEWKRQYGFAVKKVEAILQKAVVVQGLTNKEMLQREDSLREALSNILAEKEKEVKDKAAEIERAEQCLTNLRLKLKAAESKIKSYELEVSSLRLGMKELSEKSEARMM